MDTEKTPCAYVSCPNPGEPRLIERILGIGEVNLSVDMCEPHYDLRDIDDDVIDWLKEEWRKQSR